MVSRRSIGGAFLASAILLSGGYAGAAAPESPDPIKFAVLDFIGNSVTNHLAGRILEELGYNVEYTELAQAAAWQALSEGSLHVNAEQWLVAEKLVFEDLQSQKKVNALGALGLEGREAWYYTDYTLEKCPGLPDWKALKECEELFANAETAPKGRLVDFPAEWTPASASWIDALGFDLVPVQAGSEGAMIAEMRSATARKEPLLVMFFEPHWALEEFKLKPVELPAYDPECGTNPAWGVNPDKVNDCYEQTPDIIKVGWSGFDQKWPVAAKVVRAMTLTNQQQAQLVKKVEIDGQTVDQAVDEWVKSNEATWRPWVEAASK